MDYNNERQLRHGLTEEIIREIQTDVSVQQALDAEFETLCDDRNVIRTIFPSGDSKVSKSYAGCRFLVGKKSYSRL